MAKKMNYLGVSSLNPTGASARSGKGSKKRRFRSIEEWHWLPLLGVSIVAAIALSCFAAIIFANLNVGFVGKEIIMLLFSIFVLIIIGSISGHNKIGTTVILILLFISFVRLVNHDYPVKVKNTKSTTIQHESRSAVKVLGLDKTYTYELKSGESTPWLALPKNITSNYIVNSSSRDYTVIFTDGTSYKRDECLQIPLKKNAVFKVLAHSQQTVYVTVL